MPTQVRPLQDRVVVKRIEQDEKSAEGIIIPDTAKEKPQEGRVIAVGPGPSPQTSRKGAGAPYPGDPGAGGDGKYGKCRCGREQWMLTRWPIRKS